MHAYRKLAFTAALVLGAAAGSYGIAGAASGPGSSTASPLLSAAGQPWHQRSDETLLTADTKSKVEAAATAKLSGATIVRTETDADGNAAYEVHLVQADGTPATVYVDKSYRVVKVETGMPRGGPRQQGASA